MRKSSAFWSERVRESALLTRVDRVSEVLFGLIMVLTFTGAISIASDGKQEIRELLVGALGCNLAWGLVDAIMYLMNVYIERGHSLQVVKSLQEKGDRNSSRELLREELPPLISSLLDDDQVDRMQARFQELPPPAIKHIFTIKDFTAAIQIFLLVFLCTFPVALPFLFLHEIPVAMRASNGIALIMLFIGGFMLAEYAGFRKGITALIYMSIGLVLVAVTIALGG